MASTLLLRINKIYITKTICLKNTDATEQSVCCLYKIPLDVSKNSGAFKL